MRNYNRLRRCVAVWISLLFEEDPRSSCQQWWYSRSQIHWYCLDIVVLLGIIVLFLGIVVLFDSIIIVTIIIIIIIIVTIVIIFDNIYSIINVGNVNKRTEQ